MTFLFKAHVIFLPETLAFNVAVQVWSPTKGIEIGLIEMIQAKATKIPYSVRNVKYEAKLTKWGINRLEDRLVIGYLIEM